MTTKYITFTWPRLEGRDAGSGDAIVSKSSRNSHLGKYLNDKDVIVSMWSLPLFLTKLGSFKCLSVFFVKRKNESRGVSRFSFERQNDDNKHSLLLNNTLYRATLNLQRIYNSFHRYSH